MAILYREQAPPAPVESVLECAWISTADGGGEAAVVRPDGCMDLIFDGTKIELVGAMTVTQRFAVNAPVRLHGLRFHSGWLAALMGIDAAAHTDRSLDLRDVDSKLDRAMRPAFAAGTNAVFEAIGAWTGRRAAPKAALRALDWARARHGAAKVDWLAGQCGLSERQFRRQTIEQTGLPPKLLFRIWRFRRARALAGRIPWAGLAAVCGYADQSHLIRDWREFTGDTPAMSEFSNSSSPSAR